MKRIKKISVTVVRRRLIRIETPAAPEGKTPPPEPRPADPTPEISDTTTPNTLVPPPAEPL